MVALLVVACGGVSSTPSSSPTASGVEPASPQLWFLESFGQVSWELTHAGENVLLRAPNGGDVRYVFRATETTPDYTLYMQAGSRSPVARAYWLRGEEGPGWFVIFDGSDAEHRRPHPLHEYATYPAAVLPPSIEGALWIHPLTPPPRTEPSARRYHRNPFLHRGPTPPWSHLRRPERFLFGANTAGRPEHPPFAIAGAHAGNGSFQLIGERHWTTTWREVDPGWLVTDARRRRFLVAKERVSGEALEALRQESESLPAWLQGEWIVSTAERGRLRLTLARDRFVYVSTLRREPFRREGRLRWTEGTLVLEEGYRTTRAFVVRLASGRLLTLGRHETGEVEQPPRVPSPADLSGAILVRAGEDADVAPSALLGSDLARFCEDGTEGAFEQRWRTLARSPWGLEATWALGAPAATRSRRFAGILHRFQAATCPAVEAALTRNPCTLEAPTATPMELVCPADTELRRPYANVTECVHRIDRVPHGPRVLRHRDGSVEESCYVYDDIVYLTERDPSGAVRHHHRYDRLPIN